MKNVSNIVEGVHSGRKGIGRVGVAVYAVANLTAERRRSGRRTSSKQATRPLHRDRPLLRVGVVGGGLAGMIAADKLLAYTDADVEVVVFEANEMFGGRASVSACGAEHCTRTFLGSYTEFFAWLAGIANLSGGSLRDNVVKVARYADDGFGRWVRVDHSYSLFDPSVTIRRQLSVGLDRLRVRRLDAGRLSGQIPLVGLQAVENTNLFSSASNYSNQTLRHMVRNMRGSRDLYALPGATSEYLVEPILGHLNAKGVKLRAGQRVSALRPAGDGVDIVTNTGVHRFDDVVLALAAPDAAGLLDVSGLAHRIPAHPQTHCKTLTIQVNPAEPVIASGQVAVRHGHGLSVLIQPAAQRIVVLAGKPVSTEDEYLLAKTAEVAGLRFPTVSVQTTNNTAPGAGVWGADPVRRRELATLENWGIFAAGGYLAADYPLDSAETAARSAHDAVLALLNSRGLGVNPLVRQIPYHR